MGPDETITGGMVRSHLDALRERIGPAAFDRAVESLDPAARDELRLVTPLSWVRIRTLESVYAAIAPQVGTTVESLHIEIASVVVGRAVTTLWRALLNFASDDALIKRSPAIFKRAYQQGRLEVLQSSRGSAELAVVDWPEMSEFAMRGLRVGIESTLRAAGRRNAKGASRRTTDGAILRFEWIT